MLKLSKLWTHTSMCKIKVNLQKVAEEEKEDANPYACFIYCS